jgi:hypothetical protein
MAYNSDLQIPKLPGLSLPSSSSMRGDHKKSSRFAFKDGQCVFTPREEESQARSQGSRPATSTLHPLTTPSAEWHASKRCFLPSPVWPCSRRQTLYCPTSARHVFVLALALDLAQCSADSIFDTARLNQRSLLLVLLSLIRRSCAILAYLRSFLTQQLLVVLQQVQ